MAKLMNNKSLNGKTLNNGQLRECALFAARKLPRNEAEFKVLDADASILKSDSS